MTEDSILKALAGQGPAWTLLGLTITAFWLGIRWAKPWAEEVLRAHIDLMKAMSVNMPSMAKDIAEIKETVEGKYKLKQGTV